MVRFFWLTFFCVSFLYSSNIDTKINSFLGDKEYHIQKNLIDIIFQNKSLYYKADGSVDDLKVLSKLKESGLLKFFYTKPLDMELSFVTQGNSLIFMRVVNEALGAMGYNYFITKEVIQDEHRFLWKVSLSTEHIVDPILFSKELHARGCEVNSITKDKNNNWIYTINSDDISIKALHLDSDTTIHLKKPIKPYWLNLDGIKSVSIRAKLADRWHPSAVFYDKSLKVLSFYQRDEVVNAIKLSVPDNAKYIKISDKYTLDNIKRGLSLYLRSQK